VMFVVHYLLQVRVELMRQWLAGCVLFLLTSFLHNLLLHPVSQLGLRQRMGVFLVLSLLSMQVVVWARLSPAYLRWLVEACSVSVHARGLWFWDLVSFWVASALVVLCMMPFFAFMYFFTFVSAFWVYVLWCVVSPLLLVQLYLVRLVGLWMRSGMAMVWIVLLPWVLPSFLMVSQVFDVLLRQGAVFSASLLFFLGVQMLMLAVFTFVLSVVLEKSYHHLCLR